MSEFVPAPIKPVVDINVLQSLDIRIGTIQRVEEVRGSEKLMKLTAISETTRGRFSLELRPNAPIHMNSRAARRFLS